MIHYGHFYPRDSYTVSYAGELLGVHMLSNELNQKVAKNRSITTSIFVVMLMVMSTTLTMMASPSYDQTIEVREVTSDSVPMLSVQSAEQMGQGGWDAPDAVYDLSAHPALTNLMWADPGVAFGIISDPSSIELLLPEYSTFLEENNRDDHDNDGINDLNDLDDDNDGIYDLIERFDGCYGTDPFDHDNDGILDADDYDDDNDGILEGPIDIPALEALGLDPVNVSTDRYVTSTTIHPLTGQPVGNFYLADQNPMDHDNDGVTDEDSDGSGAGRYDEDDDNDGRIDQFTWPCDFDNDGTQDYFDTDDDNDGVLDHLDAHPYDASNTTLMSASGMMFDAPQTWQFNDYRTYSGGVNFVNAEANRVNAPGAPASGFTGIGQTGVAWARQGTPAFTDIIDGDLDGDGIPNFLDPDNENDGTPDNVDTDDDNDGILDMVDPDDDNDGIPDVCINIDTNGDGIDDYLRDNSSLPYQTPGADTDGVTGLDCEIDYDNDLDDDKMRAFDQNYNAVYDWLDSEMGGTTSPDNLGNVLVSGDATNIEYDLDNDNIPNENDSFPLNSTTEVAGWNCPSLANPNPINPSPNCNIFRASFSQFNDWDGDGISNWDDVDDDNDGIIDPLDIDPDCDLDNDADLHAINGALYRDDGPNSVDSDIDGDGLENDIDWDDDNDGIADLYDPDDGNCGVVDSDNSDAFATPFYPIQDQGALDGSQDSQQYADNTSDWWSMVYGHNPFSGMMLNYNGYDATTTPVTPGTVPEFYWYMYARWSSYQGSNDWDIDTDGDSLINGLDIDQDGDGMPDWFDQDEGNDGKLDVNDIKMGGTHDQTNCGYTVGQLGQGFVCGLVYSLAYHMPLNGVNAQFGAPYSTRPDSAIDQGNTAGGPSGNWGCTVGAQGGCYHYDFGADGNPEAGITHTQMVDNRDAYITWVGLLTGIWQWNSDNGAEADFPDELGADLLKNDVDGDQDGDFTNKTVDLDDDYDAVYDWFDVDDDNDGVWDYFEVDSNDDLDDDTNQENGNFFSGNNCVDNDDDGNDLDADDDGFFQAVWDRGIMSQGLLQPSFYDVDNDNDGVPDGEDWDDDNNGMADVTQDQTISCFWGEEQSTWDHDNDGIVDWADDDKDGDGRSDADELLISDVAPFDHDNDGLRDDIDEDDDADGMKDEDEVLLWPTRFGVPSTNPWDHDDFGGEDGIANPNDPGTGPDVIDNDDDNDTRIDADYDILEEGYTSDVCAGGNESSDWDSDNDCVPDEDDKAPTFITLNLPPQLWIDARSPALFTGHVDWVNVATGVFESAPGLPVQVHIEWATNNTTAVETIDVLTDQNGNFTVGQFLFPEDITVGDSSTYRVYAEVTEMFAFNGNRSQEYNIGVSANLTVDYSAWTYFRSDEQPFWLDFKSHYTADWERGIYDNRLVHAPMTFSIFGGQFGNLTSPTNFTGLDGNGYRTDETGWASLTFVQSLGINGTWKQVRWNSTMDNGAGQIPGGYEQIIWNNLTKVHNVLEDSEGNPVRYDYTNTSLPPSDLEVIARVSPELATEWPFPYTFGDASEPFSIRVMHRMNINGTMIVEGTNPVFYFDATINNGDGTFGNWATLFHAEALTNAGLNYNQISAYKPYPTNWDGNPSTLTDEAARLRPFISTNSTHWFIQLTNGGDGNLPPCGAVDPTDPNSAVRCEIVPEMNTGDSLIVTGAVSNRTMAPWTADPIALQVDIDNNGQFLGAQETAYTARPTLEDGQAKYEYNWTWYNQYGSGTYGLRVDFTNSAFYFTGNSSTLAPTGAYINVTVIGESDFQMTSVPRLYRNTSTMIQAKLVDNALRPIRNEPVNWTWSADGRNGINFTDDNGFFEIPFNVTEDDALGNFSLQFEFPGNDLIRGSSASQSVWIVSRTYLGVVDTDPNIRQSGDRWDFTATVKDDAKTPQRDSTGSALNGPDSPTGGLVDVIFEGTSFDSVQHRQIVATLAPSAGLISLPEPQPDGSHLCFYDGNGDGFADRDANQDGTLDTSESIGCLKANISPLNPAILRDDPASFLPDGFGPVNVILRFRETLPNEGCEELEISYLGIQGQWDPCTTVPGNDHYRITMTNNANGFSLIGRTTLTVDDQIVYTSEIDPLTGEVVPKPMVVTGQLTDELGTNLTNRLVRVNYEMVNGQSGPVACQNSLTDGAGRFSITCPLSGVLAGKAKVTVTYSSYDNNDAYRYDNKTIVTEFDVFSNSTLAITEVGPFRSSVESFRAENGSIFPVLYLKESFHVDAMLAQSNGQFVGGKCLNIYLDPQDNVRPVATIRTDDIDGTISWYSGDPTQNPSLKGVETTGGKREGFRTLRVAFEPDRAVPGGCDRDISNVLNGSSQDITVLVRSRVDLQVKQSWSFVGDNGLAEGATVNGSVALLRDRIDLAVADQEITFATQYWSINESAWVNDGTIRDSTSVQGVANFTWDYPGLACPEAECDGRFRIIAYYAGSTYFAPSTDNITHEITYLEPVVAEGAGFFTPAKVVSLSLILVVALVLGALYYQNQIARKQVDHLRGLIHGTGYALEIGNEYIATIFNCYKDLVKHFKKHGYMKKVYDTTREFEHAVRASFHMIPADQLDAFLSLFEEARYSDHTIGADQRDRAIATLRAISTSLTMALGEEGTVERKTVVGLYDQTTKAGEFKTADGTVIQAGQAEGEDSGFSI